MQKWEYLDIGLETKVGFNPNNVKHQVWQVNGEYLPQKPEFYEYMNELGMDGWKLVAVDGERAYFKRPISN